MKKALKVISNILFYLVLALLIFVSVTTINAKKNNEIPTFFGYKVFDVLTGSMEPTIPEGSLIIIKETPQNEIENGDVITFRFEGQDSIVTHRIVEVINDGQEFITKGDANNANDSRPIKYNEIEGVVTNSFEGVGDIMTMLSNNMLYIIIGILGISILFPIVSSFKKKKL